MVFPPSTPARSSPPPNPVCFMIVALLLCQRKAGPWRVASDFLEDAEPHPRAPGKIYTLPHNAALSFSLHLLNK